MARGTLLTKLKEIALPTAMIGTIATASLGFSVALHNQAHIYSGPLDTQGISNVNARQVRRTGPGFHYLAYDGNRITVETNEGTTFSIRDYNGNFKLDEEDEIRGTVPNNVDPQKALTEIKKRAGKLDYLSFY